MNTFWLQTFEKSLAMNVSRKQRALNYQHFAYLKFTISINIDVQKDYCVKVSLLLILMCILIKKIIVDFEQLIFQMS